MGSQEPWVAENLVLQLKTQIFTFLKYLGLKNGAMRLCFSLGAVFTTKFYIPGTPGLRLKDTIFITNSLYA